MGPPGDDDDFRHFPPFSPDSDIPPPPPQSGPDGSVQMQQAGQLLHQYSNPDLPLGMFPQAVEPLHQTHDAQQSLNPYQETLLWPGHSLSDPAQPVPPPLDPNQETLLWPGPHQAKHQHCCGQ
eukprot:1944785-Amphidinium_carterae.1